MQEKNRKKRRGKSFNFSLSTLKSAGAIHRRKAFWRPRLRLSDFHRRIWGRAVCTFALAVNRKTKDGKDDVTFIDVVTWGKVAAACAAYLMKGGNIYCEGHLTCEMWTGRDGAKRSRLKVTADSVQFIASPRPKSGPEPQNAPPDGHLYQPDDCKNPDGKHEFEDAPPF